MDPGIAFAAAYARLPCSSKGVSSYSQVHTYRGEVADRAALRKSLAGPPSYEPSPTAPCMPGKGGGVA